MSLPLLTYTVRYFSSSMTPSRDSPKLHSPPGVKNSGPSVMSWLAAAVAAAVRSV